MATKVINGFSQLILQKSRDYSALVKLRLNLLVVFTAVIGYLLALSGGAIDWNALLILGLGGFLVTGAANTLNQVIEKDLDKFMDRTANRPLATGRMSITEAIFFAGILSVAGLLLLASFNLLTAFIGALSLISYAFIYTPMKRMSPIAVLVGAFPGALPPLIGWVAYTGTLGPEALALFGIQFMWQFPHFWAIAWVSFEDYAKAGFYLLPSKGGRDKNSAMQCVIYTLLLILTGFAPWVLGLTGITSLIIVSFAGLVFLAAAINLYRKMNRKAALMLMFGSFFYLPVAFLALVFDKI